MSTNDLPQNDLFPQGQIRLAELSVCNWGSFHGHHTASIDRKGTLITGDNGTGKSTFVDGLMALLLPAGKAAFNMAAAQGDRSDRSLLSYMRGSFGSAHDGSGTRIRSKREKGVVTGLRALYRYDDSSCITLASLFWTTGASNAQADVKRIYVIAKRNMRLSEMLDVFGGDRGGARKLKQWLRDEPTITCCDDNFSEYQELYRKLLYMDNKNAPALLSRALGLKKIDDLTRLIRELVLEPSNVRGDVRKVVDEFADLVAIHNELIDAKEQCAHLIRLPELAQTISRAAESLKSLTLEKRNVAAYFGEQLSILWTEKMDRIRADIDSIARKIGDADVHEKDAQKVVEDRHGEYVNLGGDRIEHSKDQVTYIQNKLEDITRTSAQYQHDCRKLGLSAELNEQIFIENKNTAERKRESIEDETMRGQDTFAEAAAQYSRQKDDLNAIGEEIREIEARPDSNIDLRYQRLRDEMMDSLGLSGDELVFIGELIDVNDNERSWQGAIERAMGGLRTTLLVPASSYSMVTRWLNVRHTGIHVRVQVVLKNDAAAGAGRAAGAGQFKERGYVRKLIWKEHRYREWLQAYLMRFDLQCVAGTDELDATPFSMTKEGLAHKERGRFEKKDISRIDDRRKWCLGFSNTSLLRLLRTDQKTLTRELTNAHSALAKEREALNAIAEQAKLWERLDSFTWKAVNAPYWHTRLENARADLAQLEESGGDLEKAKQRWETAKSLLQTIRDTKGQLLVNKGSLEKDRQNADRELKRAREAAAAGLADNVRALLKKRVGIVRLENPEKKAAVERELEGALEKARMKKNAAENSATGIMGAFRGKDKWQPITVDWHIGIDGLHDYVEHYHRVETEGLPQLIDRFKERLNKHATQSLARIKTKLESERDDILERIETINAVLRRTEFKQGSYLKLDSRKEKYPHVQNFESKLRQSLSQATSDNHEARFAVLADVVAVLEKASAPGTAASLESLRLLDPRYQMSFFAEERDSESHTIRDVLESSSGKSGGEKESFAGTIVAASLAYVLTPNGHDRPVYSTVFLDEAFSNTAETVSRRVLRIFKELHIHVNLITPYKNLNLAREAARSLLIAERDSDLHESHLCEVTWEEIDRRMDEMTKKETQHEAELLNVELEEVEANALK